MTSIGDELRTERLRRGLTLDEVAAETKIDLCYLAAMEENRFDDLSLGAFFRRSFLRQYARILEIDESHLLNCLKQQFETLADGLPAPTRKPLPHIPRVVPYLFLVIVAVSSFYRFDQNRRRADMRAPLASKPTPVSVVPVVPPDSSGSASREAQPQTTSPVQLHVAIIATEPVWLSVSSDGITAYKGMLQTQQIKTFDSSAKLTVLAGNAQGLQVALNGKPVGPVGSHGEVVLLEFTPAGFRIARPIHKVSEDPPDPETSDAPL